MKFIARLLLALALFNAGIGPSLAAPDKPLVIVNGQTQRLPSGDTLQVNAPSSSAASINMPHGTAPTTPNNGDCWTTTAGLYCRINGSTVGPYNVGASVSGTPATNNCVKWASATAIADAGAPCGSGGGGSIARPSIVQVASAITGSFNVTLGSTPTAGNFLIAFCSHWNSLTGTGTGAGWTLVQNADGGVTSGGAIAVKVAGSSEATTQTPFTGNSGGAGGVSTVIYEISGAIAVIPLNRQIVKEVTASPFTLNITGSRNSTLILGAVFRQASNTAFTVATYTTDVDITGTTTSDSPRRAQGLHLDANSATNGNVSVTFSGGNFVGTFIELLGG